MSESLAWALAIVIVLGIGCFYNLHRIADTLKAILGHLSNMSEDVNGIAGDAQESADALRKIRDNTSKK